MSRKWILTSQEGFETSLKYEQNIKVPSAAELRPHEVLVKMHSASINPRELAIASPDVRYKIPRSSKSSYPLIPCN